MDQNENPAKGIVNAAIIELVCLALFVAGLVALTGCSTNIKNQGEVGFRWGTEVTFFSRAAQTAPESATASMTLPSIEEWFLRERTQATPATGATEPTN